MSRPDLSVPRFMDGSGADHEWHMRINEYDAPHGGPRKTGPFDPASDGKSFLYEAKTVAEEVPRIAYWFARERLGEMPQSHRQCSHSSAQPVPDNHLTCCLGVECRKCPHLAVIDRVEKATPEQRDAMKAWTCATHILMRGGDTAREGYVLTTDDAMYWRNLYASLAGGDPGDPEPTMPEPSMCGFCSYEEADGSLIEQCAECKAKDAAREGAA